MIGPVKIKLNIGNWVTVNFFLETIDNNGDSYLFYLNGNCHRYCVIESFLFPTTLSGAQRSADYFFNAGDEVITAQRAS